MSDESRVTAAVLIIGDEILSGRTTDKNVNYIAKHLARIGIRLCEVRVVPDIKAEIVDAVRTLSSRFDYVFSTGGIGPTHDDITADSMAKAFDVPIDIDPRAVEMMRRRYSDEQLHGDRMRMARIPAGADLVENPLSQTPGFMIENVVVMAGIPSIMQCMLDVVTPRLRTGTPLLTRTLRVIAPESAIAAGLRQVLSQVEGLSLGSYPFVENGVLGAHLVLRSTDTAVLATAERLVVERMAADGIPCEAVPAD